MPPGRETRWLDAKSIAVALDLGKSQVYALAKSEGWAEKGTRPQQYSYRDVYATYQAREGEKEQR